MLKLRYYLRLFQAFLSRFKSILLLSIGVGVFVFLILVFVNPLLFDKKVEKIGRTGRFTTENIPNDVLSLVGEGLTKIDEKGNIYPALANSWEFEDDGKTWIFHLDQQKLWQDGKKVTSDTISYNFEDVNIERPNTQTIIFHLKESFAPFPSVVSTPIFKKGFLGTGQWKVTKLSLVGNYLEYITLQNNSGNKKVIRFYPTEDQTKIAYKLGEINKIEDVIDPAPLDTWNTARLTQQIPANRYVAVFFNMQDPLFNDNNSRDRKSFRQALSYAIDKDSLSQNRALGPISPESWAFNPQIKDYSYDKKRADELLDMTEDAKKSTTIKLTTTSTLLPIAEKIVKNWNDLGIKASVIVTSGIPTEYQAFLAIYDSPYDPDQYVTWHSSQQATNISKYASPRIDKLLEDGRLETDKNARKKIYLDFQRFLLEDAPAAFLYHPVSYTIERK
ncbi:ABC transporter substrate-binding protein [Candidatus Microgenomates bacterium]|nr:ABC transporter substrate-binding protein [Candidatus Microgenomates bacterium]